MGADHDIHRALGQAGAGLRGLLVADHPRQTAYVERKTGEAFGEAIVMLAGEQRGGGDDRHLLPGHGGDEGGAQGDLGLAETDIAADQAVHRAA